MTMDADSETFDLVVLGGGSAGETAASRVAMAGRSVALIESRLVGGECPYWGCVPSKALLIAARERRAAGRAHLLGAAAGPLNLGDPSDAWQAALRVRDERAEHLDDSDAVARLQRDGVTVIRGVGSVSGPGRVRVADRELGYRNLLVATGAEAVPPPIPGLADVGAWFSDDALTAAELPARLAIIGGGAIGCELSQVYSTFGSTVILVESLDRLLAGEEPQVSAAVADVLRAGGVDVRTSAVVDRVDSTSDGIALHLGGGATLTVDRLLVATGRRPRVAGLGLERLGIDVGEGRLVVGDDLRVRGQEQVYAAGDVTGRTQFTHMANYAARVVAANVLGTASRMDRRAVPRGVYIDPPVAGVGLTAAEARDAGHRIVTAEVDVGGTARAWLENESGVLVLVADAESRSLIGASAIGPRAEEWIAQVTLAIRAEVPVRTLVDTVQPFPAVSETLLPGYERLAARLG